MNNYRGIEWAQVRRPKREQEATPSIRWLFFTRDSIHRKILHWNHTIEIFFSDFGVSVNKSLNPMFFHEKFKNYKNWHANRNKLHKTKSFGYLPIFRWQTRCKSFSKVGQPSITINIFFIWNPPLHDFSFMANLYSLTNLRWKNQLYSFAL